MGNLKSCSGNNIFLNINSASQLQEFWAPFPFILSEQIGYETGGPRGRWSRLPEHGWQDNSYTKARKSATYNFTTQTLNSANVAAQIPASSGR